jgi:hypothetical protein
MVVDGGTDEEFLAGFHFARRVGHPGDVRGSVLGNQMSREDAKSRNHDERTRSPFRAFAAGSHPQFSRQAAARALIGGAIWVICWFWFQPSWEMAVLWLAALVHVPLALALIDRQPVAKLPWKDDAGEHPRLASGAPASSIRAPAVSAHNFVLPAAVLLVASFQPEVRGVWLALPWAAVAVWFGLSGIRRLLTLGFRRVAALADWGLGAFAVSGVVAACSAAEWDLFGFPPVIILLTPVHQMIAGLVLQVVAWRIVSWRQARIPLIAAIGVSVGNPLVALGIGLTAAGVPPIFEYVAVCIFASSIIVLGWMQLFLAFWPRSRLPLLSRVLLVISDLSLGTAMTLAIIYAWGTVRGYPTLTIPEMIVWHGTLNAIGFALPALVGWSVAGTPPTPSSRAIC